MRYKVGVVKKITFLFMTMALTVALVACQGAVGKTGEPGPKGEPGDPRDPAPPANLAPQARALTLPAVMLVEEGASQTINVAANFFDTDAAEGETLTLTHSGWDANVVTVTLTGGMLTVGPEAAGSTVITVTATDAGGLTASAMINVTVHPEGMAPPTYDESLIDIIPLKPGEQYVISGADIENAFDESEGESLTFGASGSDDTIVMVTQADDNTVTITALAMVGDATVTITATDEDDLTVEHVIEVAVRATLQPEAIDMTPAAVALSVGGAAATVDVSMYFVDPDVGDLMYEASSSDDTKATAAADGSMVTITPVAAGMATVTVTASNAHGSATQMISVTVAATPPTKNGSIPDQPLTVGQSVSVGLAPFFTAGAGGGPITSYTFSVTGDVNAVSATVLDNILRIDAHAVGSAVITVTAMDADGETENQTINVTVELASMIPTVIKNIADQMFEHDGGPKSLMLSNHFSGATSYAATQNPQGVVTTEVSDDHVLTITRVGAGRTVVTVTASNAAGMRALEFNVTVDEAPMGPELESGMEFSDLRITLGNANRRPFDLDAYISDPDGIDENLKFRTVTDGSDTVGVFEDDRDDRSTGIDAVTAPADMTATTARYVIIHPVAVGAATITVTATDEDGNSESFEFDVRVIATANDPVEVVSGSTLVATDSEPHGNNRFKSSDRASKVVTADDALVSAFFEDDDLARLDDPDEVRLEVMYIGLETDGSVAVPADLDDVSELGEDKVVADVDVMPDTWNGSTRTKISVSVTPEKSGAPHGVLIVATDLSGAKAAHAFRVQVNNAPKAYSSHPMEKDRQTLADVTSVVGMTVSATEPPVRVRLVNSAADQHDGYFSDEDGDALLCRFAASDTSDSPVATIGWVSGSERQELSVVPNKRGQMSVDVWCFDQVGATPTDFESSEKATLNISVSFDGSVH